MGANEMKDREYFSNLNDDEKKKKILDVIAKITQFNIRLWSKDEPRPEFLDDVLSILLEYWIELENKNN